MFDWFPYNAVIVFVFWFLRIISEGTGEWGLVFSGLTMETPKLLHWHCSDLYLLTLDMFFSVLSLKVLFAFINTVCALSLSDVAITESLLLNRFPAEQFFFIQNPFRQQPQSWLLVTSVTSTLAQVVVK